MIFRNSSFALALLIIGAITLIAVTLYQTQNFSKNLEFAIEYLKRGSLGDYMVLDKAIKLGKSIVNELATMKKVNNTNRAAVLEIQERAVEKNKEFIEPAPENPWPCAVSIIANRIFATIPWLKKKYFWGSGLWSKGYYIGTAGNGGFSADLCYGPAE